MTETTVNASNSQDHSILCAQIAMMGCCIFNFDILWNLKESLLITRLGAEVIPFMKLGVVMPVALIFLITYSFLVNHLNKRLVFYISLCPFLLWMPIFSLVIYPNLESFAPHMILRVLDTYLPPSLGYIAGVVHYWPLTLFFALAELWGTAVICILFWTTVNDLSSNHSAIRQYPIITMVGNSASIISGPLLYYCVLRGTSTQGGGWQESLNMLACLFTIFGFLIICFYEYCHRRASDKDKYSINKFQPITSLPLVASMRYLMRCPYLSSIALVMLSYCIAINMVEVAWKSQLVLIYPTEADYSMFMGKTALINGVGSLVCGLLTPALLKISWQTAALATPFILAITALPFFIFTLCGDTHLNLFGLYIIDLPMIGLQIGMLCNALSKSAKYTLFDATKEITFIPLNNEQKYKGKAAIELVVSRLGKSASSIFQQLLIFIFGSLSLAMLWLAGAFILAIGLWLIAIKQLGKHYYSKINR